MSRPSKKEPRETNLSGARQSLVIYNLDVVPVRTPERCTHGHACFSQPATVQNLCRIFSASPRNLARLYSVYEADTINVYEDTTFFVVAGHKKEVSLFVLCPPRHHSSSKSDSPITATTQPKATVSCSTAFTSFANAWCLADEHFSGQRSFTVSV